MVNETPRREGLRRRKPVDYSETKRKTPRRETQSPSQENSPVQSGNAGQSNDPVQNPTGQAAQSSVTAQNTAAQGDPPVPAPRNTPAPSNAPAQSSAPAQSDAPAQKNAPPENNNPSSSAAPTAQPTMQPPPRPRPTPQVAPVNPQPVTRPTTQATKQETGQPTTQNQTSTTPQVETSVPAANQNNPQAQNQAPPQSQLNPPNQAAGNTSQQGISNSQQQGENQAGPSGSVPTAPNLPSSSQGRGQAGPEGPIPTAPRFAPSRRRGRGAASGPNLGLWNESPESHSSDQQSAGSQGSNPALLSHAAHSASDRAGRGAQPSVRAPRAPALAVRNLRQNPFREPSRGPGMSLRQLVMYIAALITVFAILLFGLMGNQHWRAPDVHPSDPGTSAGVDGNKGPFIVAGPDAKWEPLPVFHDLSALYRSWVDFSTWSPFDTSVVAPNGDQIDVQPIFSKILEEGDMYDLTDGYLFNSSLGSGRRTIPRDELENLGSESKVDVIHLEHQVVDSTRKLQAMFQVSSSQASPGDWVVHVEKRLRNLKRKTQFDVEEDQRMFVLDAEPTWPEDGWAIPANLDQVEHVEYLKETPLRHPGHGKLEHVARGTKGGDRLTEMMQQLFLARNNLNLLSQIAAHSSTTYLFNATRNVNVMWKAFELLAAPYDNKAPLKKAVQQAEGVKNITQERKMVTRMTDQIDSLIGGLDRIISCERAIDRHLDVLEATATKRHRHSLSDGYLSYSWDNLREGWVTERRIKGAEEERSYLDRGQRECQPLFAFKRGELSEEIVDLQPDGKNATEKVIQFVPAARFLHARYKRDLDYVELGEAGEWWNDGSA